MRVFRYFDGNGDGKISAEELEQCVKSIVGDQTNGGGLNLSLKEAEAVVAALDGDGDGLLGVEEFMRLTEGDGGEEELREAFKLYEMEGSGCITPRSLKRMLSRLGERKTMEECEVMIAQFDLNGDGVINFDEFRVMML